MALHHLCQPLRAWHRCHPTVSTNGVGTAVVVGRAWVAAGRTRVGVATICSGSGATGSSFLQVAALRRHTAPQTPHQPHLRDISSLVKHCHYYPTCQHHHTYAGATARPLQTNAKRPTPAARTTRRPPLTTAYSPSNQPLVLSSTTTSSIKT